MSNFTAFNPKHIEALIQPFSSGMAPHIVPIKYEAITPDIFAFLFRTTGSDGTEHFFVSLEFDYIESLTAIQETIEKWHGGAVVELWNPENDLEGDDVRAKVDDIYYAALAQVEAPRGTGYWASNIVVRDASMIESVVATLDVKDKENVEKELRHIFSEHPHVSVSVYIGKDGNVEYFFG
jgi:hypothetical protein